MEDISKEKLKEAIDQEKEGVDQEIKEHEGEDNLEDVSGGQTAWRITYTT